jgi:IS1 family transposase
MRPGPSWGKKDKHCDPDDPADAEQGSYWDHVIIDPDTKLIVSLVVGRRNADSVVQLFTDFYGRTGGHLPELIVTDEYAPYEAVILDTYGVSREELTLTPQQEREYDRDGMAGYFFPVEITYATVRKEKENNRVMAVSTRVVQGSLGQAEKTLQESEQSQTINTSFVERYHGTQRQFNARKKRKAYTFSKELHCHEACTWLVVVWYNFGWCVRTLRQKVQEEPPRYRYRTPAMAAGLADHAWSMRELLAYPLYPPKEPLRRPARTYDDVLERLRQWTTKPASG